MKILVKILYLGFGFKFLMPVYHIYIEIEKNKSMNESLMDKHPDLYEGGLNTLKRKKQSLLIYRLFFGLLLFVIILFYFKIRGN